MEYIEELKKRIGTYERQENEDRLIADLAQSMGWSVLKNRIESDINRLLEPGTTSQDLSFIGATTMARELAIHYMRSIINQVESTKQVLQQMQKDASE